LNKKINFIIEDYLETQNKTDYAILINGKWGCGKTYYVEHELKKIAENKNKKYIYVSLNGCDNFTKIVNKITCRLFFKKNNKIIDDDLIDNFINLSVGLTDLHPVISKVSKAVIGIKNSIIKPISEEIIAKLNASEIIIIFDDIERTSINTPIEVIIGQIYENYTKKGYKTIFVGDETNIDKKDYHTIKEKVIRRTISYEPEKILHIKDFINNQFSNSKYKYYLDKNNDKIIDYIIKLNITNLRTVSFIIDNFIFVYDKLDDDMKNKFDDFILKNIIILINEYKLGEITILDLNDKKNLKNYPNSYYIDKAMRERGTDISRTYLDEFHERYIISPIFEDFRFVEELFNYILTGYLDDEKLKREIKILFYDEYISESEKVFNFLIRYLVEIEEDELIENLEKFISFIKNGDYHITKLPYIYTFLKLVKDKKYIAEWSYDIENIIRSSLSQAAKNHDMIPEYIDQLSFNQKYHDIEKDDCFYNEIIEEIKNMSYNKRDEYEKAKIIKIFQAIISNDRTEYSELYHKNTFFQDTVKAKLENMFFELTNKGITIIETYLEHRFLRIGNAGEYSYNEKKALETIILFIENCINNDTRKLSHLRKVRLKELISYMQNAIEHLEKTSKKKINANE